MTIHILDAINAAVQDARAARDRRVKEASLVKEAEPSRGNDLASGLRKIAERLQRDHGERA